MAARKTTKDIEPVEATTEVEQEVLDETSDQDNIFTAEVLGEEREFVNLVHGRQPMEMMFLSNERMAMKYVPSLVEKILGEDVLFNLMDEGAEMDDLKNIIGAWSGSLKGKDTSSDR